MRHTASKDDTPISFKELAVKAALVERSGRTVRQGQLEHKHEIRSSGEWYFVAIRSRRVGSSDDWPYATIMPGSSSKDLESARTLMTRIEDSISGNANNV